MKKSVKLLLLLFLAFSIKANAQDTSNYFSKATIDTLRSEMMESYTVRADDKSVSEMIEQFELKVNQHQELIPYKDFIIEVYKSKPEHTHFHENYSLPKLIDFMGGDCLLIGNYFPDDYLYYNKYHSDRKRAFILYNTYCEDVLNGIGSIDTEKKPLFVAIHMMGLFCMNVDDDKLRQGLIGFVGGSLADARNDFRTHIPENLIVIASMDDLEKFYRLEISGEELIDKSFFLYRQNDNKVIKIIELRYQKGL